MILSCQLASGLKPVAEDQESFLLDPSPLIPRGLIDPICHYMLPAGSQLGVVS